MHVNRTGAGFHRDSRREARFSRTEAQRVAIGEQLALFGPDVEEEEPDAPQD